MKTEYAWNLGDMNVDNKSLDVFEDTNLEVKSIHLEFNCFFSIPKLVAS